MHGSTSHKLMHESDGYGVGLVCTWSGQLDHGARNWVTYTCNVAIKSLVAIGSTCYALGGYTEGSFFNEVHYASVDDLLGNGCTSQPDHPQWYGNSHKHTKSAWKMLPNTLRYRPGAAVLAGNLFTVGGQETAELITDISIQKRSKFTCTFPPLILDSCQWLTCPSIRSSSGCFVANRDSGDRRLDWGLVTRIQCWQCGYSIQGYPTSQINFAS